MAPEENHGCRCAYDPAVAPQFLRAISEGSYVLRPGQDAPGTPPAPATVRPGRQCRAVCTRLSPGNHHARSSWARIASPSSTACATRWPERRRTQWIAAQAIRCVDGMRSLSRRKAQPRDLGASSGRRPRQQDIVREKSRWARRPMPSGAREFAWLENSFEPCPLFLPPEPGSRASAPATGDGVPPAPAGCV